jgi:hypothetical protein
MLKRNMILSTLMMLSLLVSGCTPKQVTLNNFKLKIVKINREIEFLNKKLIPIKPLSKKCRLKKKNLLKLEEANHLLIDKVLRLNNTLSYSKFSYKNKKVIEKSLDKILGILFNLRKVSKNRLLALENSEKKQIKKFQFNQYNEEYLCNLELKPIQKKETCLDCIAVFN